jgi:hypothetical protein
MSVIIRFAGVGGGLGVDAFASAKPGRVASAEAVELELLRAKNDRLSAGAEYRDVFFVVSGSVRCGSSVTAEDLRSRYAYFIDLRRVNAIRVANCLRAVQSSRRLHDTRR